ncbi:MAG: hypothetical protein QOE77_3072 [Blastocatellia bacterium]|nr:hypothetical protein [Blastocatellia bacterium]
MLLFQSKQFWRLVFCFKSVWNCVICVVFFFLDDAVRDWLHAPHSDPINRSLFLSLAFAFGLGYWWVSRDPERNRDILRMAVFGQTSVFVISLYAVAFAPQPLPWPLILPGVVDLIFALLFSIFLFMHPREKTARQ